MNPAILHPDVQQFISDNLNTNISKLLFKGSPFKSVSVQELATQIVSKKKCEKKLPIWFETKNIYYPAKVNIEQTSSEVTAKYKSSIITGDSVIDITGGFGVDAYYFAKKTSEVIHCELDANLSTIVNNNYQQLKIDEIQLISGDGIDYLKNASEKYDWIYIDPSRRDSVDKKVFLLKDCLPNVPENLTLFFSKSNNILIKNSPILDISKTIDELDFVKEIHVVAVANEVKELLFVLEKYYKESIQIKTINYSRNTIQIFDFQYIKNNISEYSEPKKYVYEPNAAILKSGGFHEISLQLNLEKLHPHSHLYTSDNLIEFPGRTFLVENSCQYNKKEIKKYLKENKANITTRNFPETVAQIRKKIKIKDGGSQYLFFTTLKNERLKVLVCSQVF
ncbi:Ribosomal RNA small subunit methyltransferase J [Polaribacter huanghezhanensis]|uniref:class I SAM-dependent methyltransferase n=1 Tax=Polaribacter huanghezhanensis TaxID=1354726 RepID=UPI0026470417|nr:class I SAM-dependent methyltransferase [Polaribacter huanghezhanensis]WKD86298.1 Ribosomal RNA small subunit methyltransferase J [Polaribacter huanghezhanensis]